MSAVTAQIKAPERTFLPKDFTITTWEKIQPYFDDLIATELGSFEKLNQWLKKWSELEAVISEDACWRQIKMTCNTADPQLEAAFTYFVTEIEPKMKPYLFQLNKKLIDCPFTQDLDKNIFFPYLRSVKNALELYQEKNIPLQSEMNLLAQQFGVINGKMTIHYEDKEFTLQQAAKMLQNPDRNIRKTVYEKIIARRAEDETALNDLFDKLLNLRHQIAINAGFENYRDFKFKELGRFDYTPDDCFAFHQAVKEHIVPLFKKLQEARLKRLNLAQLAPFDTEAEPAERNPLHPFETGTELIEKAQKVFAELRPYFGACLVEMQAINRLDLESRIGKAPGGYNCPLAETGIPFIFMNAAGTASDVITMMHEGGHALHSFLSHDLPLNAMKEYPMEIAELASMSMELFSMEHWDQYYTNTTDLKRAQLDELERVISVLPWIATIDKYQHWLYTNYGHTTAQRKDAWLTILNEFSTGMVNWAGYENARGIMWQKQLHLFEVPFYYIEYGIAQLGAIAMWKQYRNNKETTLNNYMNALSLGYTKPLNELYKVAGISFDFSPAYIKELGSFLTQILNDFIS